MNQACSKPPVLYLAAEYPHARGVKWLRSFAGGGFTPVVVFGRGREDLWRREDTISIFKEESLGRKLHFRPATTAKRIGRLLSEKGIVPSAVLVRDVFIAAIAKRIAREYGCPWVLDLCDNYPEVARQLADRQRPWLRAGAVVIQRLESNAVRSADAIVFVSPESRTLVLGKVGGRRRDQQTFVVENAPLGGSETDIQSAAEVGSSLVYVGTIDSKIRDFGTVVRGLQMYRDQKGEQVTIDVFTFNREKAERELDRTASPWRDFIDIRDPVPARDLNETLRGYAAGLVPHHAGPAVDYTISNKIFDYLYAGTPVLASDNPPNVRLINRVGGGILYERESPSSFSDALSRLLASRTPPRVNSELLTREFTWEAQTAEFLNYLCNATELT